MLPFHYRLLAVHPAAWPVAVDWDGGLRLQEAPGLLQRGAAVLRCAL